MFKFKPASMAVAIQISLALYNPISVETQQQIASKSFPDLENVFEVKNINSVAVSPSGSEILYTLNSVDLQENDSNVDIWLIRKSGSNWMDPVQLTNHPGSDTNPRWHPGGESFAFLASGRGVGDSSNESASNGEGTGRRATNKLMRMNLVGGEPFELLQHETNISSFQWSPDGEHIAFRAPDPQSKENANRKKTGRDISIEDEPGDYSHIWIFDLNEANAERFTEGNNYTVGGFSWSPDSRSIVFSGTPTNQPFDSWRSDLYLLELDLLTESPTKLTVNPGPDSNPQWTPDGSHIVYKGQQSDGYEIGLTRTWKIPLSGGEPMEVSPLGGMQAGRYNFTPDGTGVFFETTTGTTRGLFYMDLEDRNPVRVTADSGVRSSFSFSKDMRVLAFAFEDPTDPIELYVSNLKTNIFPTVISQVVQLTEHNTHAESFAVGKTEIVQWSNKIDGKEVEGILVYPVGWTKGDGPRATVIKIHGGPSGVYVENFQAASSGADAQRYAGDGYFVLLPNPRGSSGYGEIGLQSVVQDWGGLDFQDIMSGVDHLIDEGYAHPDSLGVMGWSYGGFMTAWAVTQTDRFKAAVAGAAITENIAMWGTQDIQHVFEAYFGGSPYDPGLWEVYQRSNPLAFIQNASTPTMIIHGENDPRVPPNQARIFYRGLKTNGVETKLVWLPRTGHGPREPGLQYERSLAQKEWIDQHIRKSKPIT